MIKTYHLSIGYAGLSASIDRVQATFPQGAWWARYAPNSWILQYAGNPIDISNAVRTVVSENDSIFVVEVNLSNHSGFMQKELWDWINSRIMPPPAPQLPPIQQFGQY